MAGEELQSGLVRAKNTDVRRMPTIGPEPGILPEKDEPERTLGLRQKLHYLPHHASFLVRLKEILSVR